MTVSTDSDLACEIQGAQADLGCSIAWSFADLQTGLEANINGADPVPAEQFDSFVQYLALVEAGNRGDLDLAARCTLQEHHRDDGHYGVIGCMSNGLVLSLGDFLAQTVITADPAAFAVVRDETARQGIVVADLVDELLRNLGLPSLSEREQVSCTGRTGVPLGSTTTNEQIALLRWLIDERNPSRELMLKVMRSVLKGGGLGRGLPGYGPFKTQVAHVARVGIGNSGDSRADSAVFFDGGAPCFIASLTVYGIEDEIQGLPGMVVAEDFFRTVSRACWAHTVGSF